MRQRLAVNNAQYLVYPASNAAVEILFGELRRDRFADNAFAGRVIECAFETVADFDAHRAIILGNDKNRAVVNFLPSKFPYFCHAHRILLNCFWHCRGHDKNRELTAFPGFKRLQSLLQRCLLFCGERHGLVRDAPG